MPRLLKLSPAGFQRWTEVAKLWFRIFLRRATLQEVLSTTT
jgi:hypothetical protein